MLVVRRDTTQMATTVMDGATLKLLWSLICVAAVATAVFSQPYLRNG